MDNLRHYVGPLDKEEIHAGHIYYVRLQTSVGPMYKLGFTTMPNVEARLGYQGGGHEKQIDKVMGFIHYPNALKIEQKLHLHFQHRRAFPLLEIDMPFAGNAQSELYKDDILGLDREYTLERAQRVEEAIMRARSLRQGRSEESINAAMEELRQHRAHRQLFSNFCQTWPFTWILIAWRKLEEYLFKSPRTKADEQEIQELIFGYRSAIVTQRIKNYNKLKREIAAWDE